MPTSASTSRWRAAIGVVALAVLLVALLLSLVAWGLRNGDYRSGVHLRQVGLALVAYSDNQPGPHEYGPPLSSKQGRLIFEPDALYPKYLSDPFVLISPGDPVAVAARKAGRDAEYVFGQSSYYYLGYMVWDDATVLAFADAYRKRMQEGLPFDTDLPAAAPIDVIKRLDFGVYRQMIPDSDRDKPEWAYANHAWAEIPVLIERPHPYPGDYGLFLFGGVSLSKPIMAGCVLFMDGHTEFIPYPGKWPMTNVTIEALQALEGQR